MNNIVKLAGIVAFAVLPTTSNAGTVNIPYNSVYSTCIIKVGETGSSAEIDNFKTSSTGLYGGSKNTAALLTTDKGFSLTVDAPKGLKTAHDTINEGVDLDVSYSAHGANTIPRTASSTPTTLERGNTFVDISTSATRSNSGEAIDAGSYSAVVTLRCE